MRLHYELTREDVGQPIIRAFGQVWMVDAFMGQVLPGDVGKRVYIVRDVLQVENNEQRDARTDYYPEA